MPTEKKHVVSADPEAGVITHEIIYDTPPMDLTERRRLAMEGEAYLRHWGERRAGLLRLDIKSAKVELHERMVRARTPALYGIKATWPSSHDKDYLADMRKLSQEING